MVMTPRLAACRICGPENLRVCQQDGSYFDLPRSAAADFVNDDGYPHPQRLYVVGTHSETDHVVLLRARHGWHMRRHANRHLCHQRVQGGQVRIGLIGAARVRVRSASHQYLQIALLGGIATIDTGEAELRQVLRVGRLARLV